MSPAMLRRLAWALLGALLLSAALGFAVGMSAPGVRARGDSEAAAAAALAAPRESATALRVLGAGGHWGTYDAPETAAVAAPTAPPPPDLEGIARDYRLVGIERGADGAVALLLPAAGAAEVIRLTVGQALAEGITLGSIGSDSVGFSTTAGTSTLHLYDGTQP
jgi:hypothetical protein